MARGRITCIDRVRDFGFIERQGGPDIFVTLSTLPRGVFDTLQDGQEVEFEIEADPEAGESAPSTCG